jgi:O-antigen ligase
MSVTAQARAVPFRLRSRQALGMAAAALAAGALAVWLPLVGLGLAILAACGALLMRVPMPRLGRAAVVVTAVAAILGPNLALPNAPWLFAFRILIVMLGLGALGYLLLDGRLTIPAGLPLPGALLGLWFLWTALSIGWADDLAAAARWTLFMGMMGGLALAMAMACRTPRRARMLLWTLGATFGFALAVAFMELVLHIRLPTSALLGRPSDVAFGATSLFGNQNNFATYLTLTLPYFLALVVVFKDVRLRAIGIAGSVASLVALLFTGSKANLVAGGLVLLGLLVTLGFDRSRRRQFGLALAMAGLAVALVVPSVLGSGLIPLPQRAVTKFSFSILSEQVAAQQGSGAVRSSLLGDGLNLVGETGGLGVGAGNAETHVRALADFPGVGNLHDWWLEVLVNGGLIGLAIYVAFYLTLLRGQMRVARRSPDPLARYLGLAGSLALFGFVFGSLGPSTAIHFAPMWITFGLGMLTLVLARRAAAQAEPAP